MVEEQLERLEKRPPRQVYLDVLSILAAIFVVWLHFGSEVHWYDGSDVWYWCLAIQVVAFWAIPMLFMLTGAVLMNYRERYDTPTFFRRRFVHVAFPYLVWGIVLIALQIKQGSIQLPMDGDVRQFVFAISDLFVHNQMESVYWVFPVLLGIYLAMPVLSVLSEPQHRKVLNYLVTVGILTVSVIPFLYCMAKEYWGLTGIGWNSAMELPTLASYLIYPVLGYWASTRDFSKLERILCYVAAVLSAVLRYTGLRTLSERDGFTNQLYMDYKGFPALFLSLGVFVFIRYLCQRHEAIFAKASKWLAPLSSCSLGVYLIHNRVLNEMALHPFFAKYSVQWYFMWPFICYIACVIVVYIVKKVPLIRRAFP